MKRILINATQNEEIRVALCTGNHLYDFDLENRTREQKKSNIYKGHVTRVEPSLEAVFVEYGSQRQGFLPIREISSEYLSGNPRDENIKKLIKEGDELIVQVEKEERGNKGAALSTYVSLAGRYLVLMPNNPRGGGISRQISGKLREDMKRMLSNLDLAKGMSVIIRTAGIGKTQEDLQHDLNHLLNIWQAIQEQNQKYPSPRLVHQEAGVVTRAVRDYLRDDIAEIWIDNENAYIEAAGFIDAVMPKQAEKLRKYTDYEPMFSRFNIEKQIETAYQREVRLPSGGSIVIDQTEALVSIDINSAKSTKGSDVAETAYHTNLEAADEIARQLRLRDMGGLIVIDFIDMNDNKHQKEVEKRLIDATKYDRARVQFGDISKFGLMEMSRQRLRPSLEESTGYICPRCHGNGMIRDLRSLSLSIMRQIEQIALKERQGEVQAEVPTDIAAFLLNEKRDSLVYLEQDSGTRITILPHAHLESPNFKLHFNRDGFAPSSYERITDTAQEHSDLGYDVDWQTADSARPEQQPTRQPLKAIADKSARSSNQQDNNRNNSQNTNTVTHSNEHRNNNSTNNNKAVANQAQSNVANSVRQSNVQQSSTQQNNATQNQATQNNTQPPAVTAKPQAVAWLSNLFAQAPQAQTAHSVSSTDAAKAIETLVNTGATSLGSFGQVDSSVLANAQSSSTQQSDRQNQQRDEQTSDNQNNRQQNNRHNDNDDESNDDKRRRKARKSRSSKPRQRREQRDDNETQDNRSTSNNVDNNDANTSDATNVKSDDRNTRSNEPRNDNRRQNERSRNSRQDSTQNDSSNDASKDPSTADEQARSKRKPHSKRSSRGTLERNETLTGSNSDSPTDNNAKQNGQQAASSNNRADARSNQNPNEVVLQINEAPAKLKSHEIVHLSLDDSKAAKVEQKTTESETVKAEKVAELPKDSAAKDNAAKDSAANIATETSSASQSQSQPAPSEQQVADNSKETVNEAVVPATDTDTVDTVKDVVSEVANTATKAQTTDKDQATETVPANQSAQSLTPEKLFAERYITAAKFGQASNDPRVVRAQQVQSSETQLPATEQTSVKAPAIRGTVGEFIHSTLAKAQARLEEDGVINCFIAAIAEHNSPAKPAMNAATADSDNSGASFDFSNYGYQPLSADYLSRFKTMTAAVSQFAADQGKTSVAPSTITQRASNDPRGQHPSFVAQTSEVSPQESAATDNTQKDSADSIDGSADDVDAHNVAATALTSAMQADDVSAESEQLLEADASLKAKSAELSGEGSLHAEGSSLESEALAKDDSQGNKSKTTIASYKNMIENVAEQLLPQTGMFSLTTAKVPKARSRKPKTEHKKPTQAEKVETDDTDTDS
ncbi:Rne/Rng family ribonuclease [Psychrobacter sp. M13]|uniref:Rne/Rng family ribonuclease n=1 Tax=Psychrobacter sp. M13 TaxID=3067275 RepID=UPI00273B04D6|nr:Rne/Rng family ribonuclease [Psychrobacter sp. M13]WLP94858.1 Rne/Rng family ribonuclease [Psychrobacter sp. M13]